MSANITIIKQGPNFYFAYDQNGKQLAFADTCEEAERKALKAIQDPDTRTPQQIRIDNALAAVKAHGVND